MGDFCQYLVLSGSPANQVLAQAVLDEINDSAISVQYSPFHSAITGFTIYFPTGMPSSSYNTTNLMFLDTGAAPAWLEFLEQP
jgi:hypothetical protein